MAPYCSHEKCACTEPGGVDLAAWNAGHGKRFNHFRTLLKTAVPGAQYIRGCEVQDGKRRADGVGRGALHDHLLIDSPVPLSASQVQAWAMAAGFGHSAKLVPVQPGSEREAYYVSKYIMKSADARVRVPWVDLETGELVPGRYRTWSCSRSWGLRMVDIRAQAYGMFLARQAVRDLDKAMSNMSVLSVGLGAELILDAADGVPPPG